jgi:hypothetical protein
MIVLRCGRLVAYLRYQEQSTSASWWGTMALPLFDLTLISKGDFKEEGI